MIAMAKDYSSRERMLTALDNREADHVPLCFMIYAALRERCSDDHEFVERQLGMGLDAAVNLQLQSLEGPPDHRDLSGLPIRFHPEVEVRQWREERPGEPHAVVLHKGYHTPSGVLSTAVNKTDDWPYGDHVPFLDDYLCPRSRKFLVEDEKDLEALRYLLTPPARQDIVAFREKARADMDFAAEHDRLTTGGRGVGLDASAWLCGFRRTAIAAMRQPEFVEELAGILHEWNSQRMKVFLDAGVDLFIRRGWYEGTDFWSPRLYRRFILPHLSEEIEMAHDAGARFGYILTSGSMPLLEWLAEANLDVLIGADPVQGKGTDLAAMKRKLGGRVCIWGGVNGFITVEQGTEGQITEAVARAVRLLGPGGGFILSPVDNIRDNSPRAQAGVQAMIDAWRSVRDYPITVPSARRTLTG